MKDVNQANRLSSQEISSFREFSPEEEETLAKVHVLLNVGAASEDREWRMPSHKREAIFTAVKQAEQARFQKKSRISWTQISFAAAASVVFAFGALWLLNPHPAPSADPLVENSDDFTLRVHTPNPKQPAKITPAQGVEIAPKKVANVSLDPNQPNSKAQDAPNLLPTQKGGHLTDPKAIAAREKWKADEQARLQREQLEKRLEQREETKFAMPPTLEKPAN